MELEDYNSDKTDEDLIPQNELQSPRSKLKGLGKLVTIGLIVSSLLLIGCRDHPRAHRGYHSHWRYRKYHHFPRFRHGRYFHHRGYHPALRFRHRRHPYRRPFHHKRYHHFPRHRR